MRRTRAVQMSAAVWIVSSTSAWDEQALVIQLREFWAKVGLLQRHALSVGEHPAVGM